MLDRSRLILGWQQPTGIGLGRNPFLQPFASNSTWNIGVGSGATWETTGATATAHLITLTGVFNSNDQFNQPIYLGHASDPVIAVTSLATDTPCAVQNVHIPIASAPAGGTFSTGVTFTGAQSGTTLTVSGIAGGLLHPTQSASSGVAYRVTGAGITGNFMTLTAQLTGTAGSNGTYTVNRSQTIGSEAMVAVAGDQHMAFVDATQPSKLFSYYGCLPNNPDTNGATTGSTTTITAIAGTVMDITAAGVYPFGTSTFPAFNGTGTTGNGGAYIAGTVRDWEVSAGVINHALRYSLGPNDTAATGADYHTNILWPDSNCDFNGPLGGYTGVIPWSSTIGIPAATVLTGRGLSASGLMLATAIQKYGMYQRDTGGSNQITLYTDTISAGNTSKVSAMQSDFNTIIVPLLRVMTNQTTDRGATNLNGGGSYPPTQPQVNLALVT